MELLKEFATKCSRSYYLDAPTDGIAKRLYRGSNYQSIIRRRVLRSFPRGVRVVARANVPAADRCEGIAKTANTREARVASGRHAAVMRVAIFKMVENRETTVSEMINRSIRCFPTRSTVPANVASFAANRRPLFRDEIR